MAVVMFMQEWSDQQTEGGWGEKCFCGVDKPLQTLLQIGPGRGGSRVATRNRGRPSVDLIFVDWKLDTRAAEETRVVRRKMCQKTNYFFLSKSPLLTSLHADPSTFALGQFLLQSSSHIKLTIVSLMRKNASIFFVILKNVHLTLKMELSPAHDLHPTLFHQCISWDACVYSQ